MVVLSLYIINKSGGLVYQRDYQNNVINKLSNNDYLILAGTFHGVHAITKNISPVPGSSGIDLLSGIDFNIFCFQSLTQLKFLIVTDSATYSVDVISKMVYQVYADYTMKNPFYNPEMPIVRMDLFESAMNKLIKQINSSN